MHTRHANNVSVVFSKGQFLSFIAIPCGGCYVSRQSFYKLGNTKGVFRCFMYGVIGCIWTYSRGQYSIYVRNIKGIKYAWCNVIISILWCFLEKCISSKYNIYRIFVCMLNVRIYVFFIQFWFPYFNLDACTYCKYMVTAKLFRLRV